MPELITACGRAYGYPLQLEQLVGALRYSGAGFLVSDPQ